MAAASTLSYFTAAGVTPLVVVTAVVVYVVYSFVQYAQLRAFKGPKWAAISKLWLLNCVQSGKMHHIFHDISTKYGTSSADSTFFLTRPFVVANDVWQGKFARIGPTTLLVADVEFLRKVNAPKSKYHRSDWYKGSRFTPNEDTLISMTDEVEHKSLRSRMMAGVSTYPSSADCVHATDSRAVQPEKGE